MDLLERTLPTPAENVALDEALLDEAEEGQRGETLRLWTPSEPLVVIGRSSRVEQEVELTACQKADVPVIRRSSGGAAIVAGPGCLMYAVVCSYAGREDLRMIDRAHAFVLDRLVAALRPLAPGIERAGTSDLAVAGRKVSGNSLRCKRNYFLYHGVLLCGMPTEQIGRLLKMPPRQPDYRQGRDHEAFVANLTIDPPALRAAISKAFGANPVRHDWPAERVRTLVAERYGRRDWTYRFGK